MNTIPDHLPEIAPPVLATERKPVDVLALDFEQYAAQHNLSRADIGDAGAHKRGRNQSDKQWKRLLRNVEARSNEIVRLRAELRVKYDEAVARGEVRPLTRLERLHIAASGHPDLASSQAARRLLDKAALARVQGGGK